MGRNIGSSNYITIINANTRKHLIIDNKPFSTYSHSKAHELLGYLKKHGNNEYQIEGVVHYLHGTRIKCSTGDGHASWDTERKQVNCPRCLQQIGLI